MSSPPSPAVTPYPELQPFAPATTAGDWAHVYAAYCALSTDELRSGAVDQIAEADGAQAMLTLIAEQPGDGHEQLTARMMLAATHIIIGWRIRSTRRADHVSADQFRQLHEYLRRAELLLIDVVARQPDNAPAWVLRLTTSRGLELGQSESRRRYDHVARIEPHHIRAQASMVQQLCPKWSGSLESMHEFARSCSQASPAGSLNAVLIVQAHLEHWGTLSGPEQSHYLGSPAVREEVTAAANHSVLHPAYRPTLRWVATHGWFALYQSMVGNLPAAAVHFRAVGSFDASEPWGHFYGDSDKQFQQHRTAALARG